MVVLPGKKSLGVSLALAFVLTVAVAAPAFAAPAVTSFSPTSGPIGTSVVITGTELTGATAVTFNGVSSTFTVNSATQITATVPGTATTGPIAVTTPGGTATSTSSFTVTPVVITSFSPTSGAVGDCVVIVGSGFTGATAVAFGGVGATTFTAHSATRITATVPTGAAPGVISVTAPAGTATSSGSFTVVTTSTAPTICSFSPTNASVGDSVTITGTNLTGTNSVKFAGTAAASFVVNSATQITAVIATGSTTGFISVTTPSGTATSGAEFVVNQAAGSPAIQSFDPTQGTVGTVVTLTGSNFSNNTIAVKFNGITSSFTRQNNSTLTTTVPAGASTGKISVQNDKGVGISSTDFTVLGSAPTVTSFSPTTGPPGTTVFINGTDFETTTQVSFNGVSAAFTVNSTTNLTATVPAGATTGPITVTNSVGSGTSASSFTVTGGSPAPTITSFTPTSGAVGQAVVITGTGFTGATGVRFAGTPAIFTVNSDTQISTTVPSGAITGPISVTTPSGTATSASNFTVSSVPTTHSRSVTLSLVKSLVAKGKVSTSDGFADCVTGASVKVQKRVSGAWKTLRTVSTDALGNYKASLADKPGKYRALVPKKLLPIGDICGKAVSPSRRN